MKLTEDIIKELECALDMRGKDGNPIWEDGDDISIKVAGTFKNDKFIVIQNNTKRPFEPSQPNPDLVAHHSKENNEV